MSRPLFAGWASLSALGLSACLGVAFDPGPANSPSAVTGATSPVAPDAGERSDSGAPADAGFPPDAGSDAGRPDAGQARDAGSTPSLCPTSGLVFCDGFDGPAYDANTWSEDGCNTPGTTLTTDTQHVYRGTSALRAHIAQQGAGIYAGAILNERKSFPTLANAMYGRVFIYFEADPPPHNMGMVTGHQLNPHQGTYSESINVTRFYAVQWNQSPHVDEGFNSATQIQLNHWMCLEWYYSGAVGETRTWVDGTELTDIHETGWIPVQFQQLDLGIGEPEGDLVAPTGFDAWFDELALDTARIGCDR
jgi:hypothetical protein